MVCVWRGVHTLGDVEQIVPVEHWDEPTWARNVGDSMVLVCNYLFITDNLLDPSHVAWVHRTSFGNEACEDEPVRSTLSADGVAATRWMYNVEVAPFYAPLVGFAGHCDRLQKYEVRFPSQTII